METTGAIIAAVILGGLALFTLLRFLLTNFLISRILCFVCAVGGIVCGIMIADVPPAYDPTELVPAACMLHLIFGVFGWLTLIGPVVFDVEWTGGYWLDFDTGEITPQTTGGFFANLLGAAVVNFIFYGLGCSSDGAFFLFLAPLFYIVINIYMMIKSRC